VLQQRKWTLFAQIRIGAGRLLPAETLSFGSGLWPPAFCCTEMGRIRICCRRKGDAHNWGGTAEEPPGHDEWQHQGDNPREPIPAEEERKHTPDVDKTVADKKEAKKPDAKVEDVAWFHKWMMWEEQTRKRRGRQ